MSPEVFDAFALLSPIVGNFNAAIDVEGGRAPRGVAPAQEGTTMTHTHCEESPPPALEHGHPTRGLWRLTALPLVALDKPSRPAG